MSKNKKFLTAIAAENQKMKIFIPETKRIPYDETKIVRCPANDNTKVLFLETTTNDCVRYIVENRISANVFAHSFASDIHPGGGYLNGARAQEEFECYEIPGLFPSISRMKYPLEPGTILVTPGLTIMRDGSCSQGENYGVLPENKQIKVGIVSSAAQNLSRKDTVYDDKLTKRSLANLFCSVKICCPETDTLVLGAWGCGVFRNDPFVIANEIKDTISKFGGYYENIVIAIPSGPNVKEFKLVFGFTQDDEVEENSTVENIMKEEFENLSAETHKGNNKSNRKKKNCEKHNPKWFPGYE